jgi:hypothetical protein
LRYKGTWSNPTTATPKLWSSRQLLTEKTCIHLRSASVRTYTSFTTKIP